MAISDNPDRQSTRSQVRRTQADEAAGKQSWWSDKQKLETVQTYLMLGNAAMTARVLKIPEQTVYRWKATTWWKEIEGELKIQDELQLSARLKKIVGNTLDAVEDRLEHGDYVYDQKSGKMRRKPVSMKDAHKVAMDLVDKRAVIESRNRQDSSEEQMEDKLLKMMKQFAEFAQNKLDKNNTVEAEDARIIEESDNVEIKVVQDDGIPGEILSTGGDGSSEDLLQEVQNYPPEH